MVTREDIVTEARKYIGTPFHHQGRLIGVGIDCVGLLTCVMRSLGLSEYDNTSYAREPSNGLLTKELQAHLDEIPLEDVREGDVLVFWFGRKKRNPQHVGIRTDRGMLHTYADVKKVVEHGLTAKWTRRLCGAYRFRGVR